MTTQTKPFFRVSPGMDKFDHLADKISRSVFFLEELEAEIAGLRDALAKLRRDCEELAFANRQLAERADRLESEQDACRTKAEELLDALEKIDM